MLKNLSQSRSKGEELYNQSVTSIGERCEEKIREGYRRFYRRPKRLVRELRHPLRFAGKLARYATLFRSR